MTTRRKFIVLAGGAAAWPLAARAQQADHMRRVGLLIAFAENDPEAKTRLAALHQALDKHGWSEGRNIRIDARFAAGRADQHHMLAKELVALQPDVILAQSPPIVAAIRHESRTIPIVFVSVSDPIGSGFVASLARPGGNITGMLQFEAGITGKWLAMLKEIEPRLARAALVGNPNTTAFDYFLSRSKPPPPFRPRGVGGGGSLLPPLCRGCTRRPRGRLTEFSSGWLSCDLTRIEKPTATFVAIAS